MRLQNGHENAEDGVVLFFPTSFFRVLKVGEEEEWVMNNEMFAKAFEKVTGRCILKMYYGDDEKDDGGRVTVTTAWRKVRFPGQCFVRAAAADLEPNLAGFFSNAVLIEAVQFCSLMGQFDDSMCVCFFFLVSEKGWEHICVVTGTVFVFVHMKKSVWEARLFLVVGTMRTAKWKL